MFHVLFMLIHKLIYLFYFLLLLGDIAVRCPQHQSVGMLSLFLIVIPTFGLFAVTFTCVYPLILHHGCLCIFTHLLVVCVFVFV
jgi:hypothetical protein